ncbi:MAG: RNA methyltransferase [Bacteroidales bacterium]|nr:RNA methyltransferase [Bacteroidales bacterium]
MRKLLNSELGRKSIEEFKKTDKIPVTVILDNIRSMNNIGSVFRTSDAFLIEKIILCGITAKPPHNDIRKTALGATESINWEYFKKTECAINKLKSDNYTILSVEQTEGSVMLQHFSIENSKKYAVIFGNEVKGVQQKIVDMSDYCIEIPQEGTKHSLNISVSAGVVLWDFYRKLNLK